MANLDRILGMASKAIGKQMQQRGQGSPQQGGSDWRDVVRTAADKLTGDDRAAQRQQHEARPAQRYGQPQRHGHQQDAHPHRSAPADPDEVALAKYDHLLRAAPPERLEQIHHDAFARLTPGQRQQVRDRLDSELPPHEHLRDDSPAGMARAATRGEVARPGLLRRVLGGRGGAFAGGAAVGAGAMAVGGLGVAVAGAAVASAAAGPVLAEAVASGVDFEGIASGLGDAGLADLGDGAAGLLGEGEQVLGDLGGVGEQASDLGRDLLGGFFDR